MSPQDWLSESIYIARPLVYGGPKLAYLPMMRSYWLTAYLSLSERYKNRAITVAIVMEVLARILRRNAPPSSELERAEYARRDRDLLWYLLRGSVWTDFSRYFLLISPSQ
jgi:peroxin-16